MPNLECIRCGVCCICAPCCDEQDEKTGICVNLVIYKGGYTSCLEKIKNPKLFDGGCFLRTNRKLYDTHKEMAEKRIGRALPGMVGKL